MADQQEQVGDNKSSYQQLQYQDTSKNETQNPNLESVENNLKNCLQQDGEWDDFSGFESQPSFKLKDVGVQNNDQNDNQGSLNENQVKQQFQDWQDFDTKTTNPTTNYDQEQIKLANGQSIDNFDDFQSTQDQYSDGVKNNSQLSNDDDDDDDDVDDDFGDFNEGKQSTLSDPTQVQNQVFNSCVESNLSDENDFGDFNEGENGSISFDSEFPLDQVSKPRTENNDVVEDGDFGDFNEGDVASPLAADLQSQSQQNIQQNTNEQKPKHIVGQLDLESISDSQFKVAIKQLFERASTNQQLQSQLIINPRSKLSDDVSSTQFICQCNEAIVSAEDASPSSPTSPILPLPLSKWSGASSESRLLLQLGLTDQAKRAKLMEEKQQLAQTSKRRQMSREHSWQARQNKRGGLKEKENALQESQEFGQDPFAASGPVWHLDVGMDGGSGSSSSTTRMQDDPFSFLFVNEGSNAQSAVGGVSDVTALDDFLAFSPSPGQAPQPESVVDPLQLSIDDNLQHISQSTKVSFEKGQQGSFERLEGKRSDTVSTLINREDKQAILDRLFAKLPDLSYMLSRDVHFPKSISK